MEEGTFVEWLKHDGDAVRAGEPLYVLESEKASEPVESIDAGTLRLTAESPKPGEVVKGGQVLGYFVGEGESIRPSPGFAGEGMGVRVLGARSPVPSPPSPLPQSRERTERAITPR